MISYKNVSDLVGFIIHNGHATLWELGHIYDLSDAYLIWECDYVPLANQALTIRRRNEEARTKAEARKYLK